MEFTHYDIIMVQPWFDIGLTLKILNLSLFWLFELSRFQNYGRNEY